MKGMILAAGYGERLRPETDKKPKPLFAIGQTCMIRNAIGYLLRHGITEMAVNLHHLGHMIKEEISKNPPAGATIHFVNEAVIMGTAGGIKGAEPYIGDSDFVVINSDILVDLDLSRAIDFHREKKALAMLVVRQNTEPQRTGVLEVADDGRLVRFLNARSPQYPPGKHYPPMMFTGIHIFAKEFFGCIPAGKPVNISTEVYPKLVESGAAVFALPHAGYWADIGTPATYRAACEDINKGIFTPYGV